MVSLVTSVCVCIGMAKLSTFFSKGMGQGGYLDQLGQGGLKTI